MRPRWILINGRILIRAALVGAVVHIALVLVEAAIPALPRFISLRSAMFGVMMISGVAGLLYARDLDGGYSAGAFGGLLAGMASAIVGLTLAAVLGTRQVFPVGLGTVVGTGIGGIGGLFGQMAANIRKLTGKG